MSVSAERQARAREKRRRMRRWICMLTAMSVVTFVLPACSPSQPPTAAEPMPHSWAVTAKDAELLSHGMKDARMRAFNTRRMLRCQVAGSHYDRWG